MLIHFTDTEGREIYINTRQVLTVRPGEGTADVKLTNGDTIQIADETQRAVDDINRGMTADRL